MITSFRSFSSSLNKSLFVVVLCLLHLSYPFILIHNIFPGIFCKLSVGCIQTIRAVFMTPMQVEFQDKVAGQAQVVEHIYWFILIKETYFSVTYLNSLSSIDFFQGPKRRIGLIPFKKMVVYSIKLNSVGPSGINGHLVNSYQHF